jgi:hypothetical protein
MKLLSRDEFRAAVFNRDGDKCVICKAKAQDAHHIIERKLWSNGGYYLDNGASLCGIHHIEAEQTTLSCEQIREACGITHIILPEHLYRDQAYDKWGNPILPNGTRLHGDLFQDQSVQKILEQGNMLGLFTHFVKYPRSYHLPWSENVRSDDKVWWNTPLIGKDVVITMKMDGENTTMYSDHIHARSIESGNHPSRDRVKSMWGAIAQDIPPGWRICGENLFAKHSIHYQELPSYFLVFSVWNESNVCLSWDDTETWANLLGFKTVPVVYRGTFYKDIAIKGWPEWQKLFNDPSEGYVVRSADAFHYGDFRNNLNKFVRKNHVQTHGHWMRGQLIPNGLKP